MAGIREDDQCDPIAQCRGTGGKVARGGDRQDRIVRRRHDQCWRQAGGEAAAHVAPPIASGHLRRRPTEIGTHQPPLHLLHLAAMVPRRGRIDQRHPRDDRSHRRQRGPATGPWCLAGIRRSQSQIAARRCAVQRKAAGVDVQRPGMGGNPSHRTAHIIGSKVPGRTSGPGELIVDADDGPAAPGIIAHVRRREPPCAADETAAVDHEEHGAGPRGPHRRRGAIDVERQRLAVRHIVDIGRIGRRGFAIVAQR